MPDIIYTKRYEEDPLAPVDLENPLAVMVVEDPTSGDVDWGHTQITVGTSATRIAAPNRERRALLITMITGTQDVYLGRDNGVTSANGQLLSGKGAFFGTSHKGEVWGIAVTSAQTVSVSAERVHPGGDQPEAY